MLPQGQRSAFLNGFYFICNDEIKIKKKTRPIVYIHIDAGLGSNGIYVTGLCNKDTK